jgi:hypothetical protein
VLATPARRLPRVIACSNCGEQNPERARFCLRCGSSLIGAPTPDEERKIVTVLFCEAVGFAGRTGDPEDLKAALAPFHARLKRDVEGYEETVDQFMGPGRARAILSPLGVRPLLEEIDDLLGEETALSS